MRILLIDDDEAVLEAVSLMLTSDGHAVFTASRPREGLALLEAGDVIDLVLTNFVMPDIGGLEVVRRVRARWPHIKVGIITGNCYALPVQHPPLDLLLTKPVELSELLERSGDSDDEGAYAAALAPLCSWADADRRHRASSRCRRRYVDADRHGCSGSWKTKSERCYASGDEARQDGCPASTR